MEGAKWLRNKSIGILYVSHVPDFEKDFFRDTLIGVTEDAADTNYDVVFIGSHMQQHVNDTSEDIADKVIQSGARGLSSYST